MSPLAELMAKQKREDKAVKIERGLANKAKFIADNKNPPITIAEYLSELLRPLIDRDWAKTLKAVNEHKDGD